VRVLVTGFGPFLSHERNPSEALARALDGVEAAGVVFVGHAPLPVEYGRAAEEALAAARRAGAEAIAALGLAAGTPHLRVEIVGRNQATAAAPDAAGAVRAGLPAEPGGPAARRTDVAVEDVVAYLQAAGFAAVASDDAGGYVCNDLYYRLLGAGLPVVFVHVPEDADALPGLGTALAEALARGFVAMGQSGATLT
jgi:pyroglutamyl-peptidase